VRADEPLKYAIWLAVPEMSELGILVPTESVPVPPVVFTYPFVVRLLKLMLPELVIPAAAVMAPDELTVKRLATERAADGAVVPIPTLPANVEVAENQLVPVTVSVLLTLLDPMPTCPPVNVEVAVTANTPDTGLNVKLSDDVNVDDPAPVKNAICVEVPEPDMPFAEPQSDPVPDTTPDASTRRHCVEPEMFDMVRFDVVALVTDTPVPDPVVKLSVGKVPYPEAVMLVVDALVAETVPSVVFPVTARYPESVWLVPEALVKNSVGNVPYPEAVMLVEETLVTDMVPSETCPTTDRYPDSVRLVEETFVSAALVLLSVGKVPYPEAVMLVEETAANVD
jgi:hypothetical protein